MTVKFSSRRGWMQHEDVRTGEFGTLAEDFRVAKTRNFVDFQARLPPAFGDRQPATVECDQDSHFRLQWVVCNARQFLPT